MRIIPTIGILEGKCVQLSKGSNNSLYNENPIEIAKKLEGAGIQYLHLVDLDGTKAEHIVNYKILEQITSKTNLKIDFDGGLKSDEDLHIAFNSGAKQITGRSVALKQPDLFEKWLSKYGGTKIILGADYSTENSTKDRANDDSDLTIIPLIKSYENKGIQYVICSQIIKDVILEKPSYELYKRILSTSRHIKLIASGGVNSIDDLNILEDLGCEGVIIGNALYEGSIRLRDLEIYS
jgi:phosphoribosylformimino-5-aminoimidazole carboxamide ribotide isomerase